MKQFIAYFILVISAGALFGAARFVPWQSEKVVSNEPAVIHPLTMPFRTEAPKPEELEEPSAESTEKVSEQKAKNEVKPVAEKPAVNEVSRLGAALSKTTLEQADTLAITIKGVPLQGLEGTLGGSRIGFFESNGGVKGLFGVGVKKNPGVYKLEIKAPEHQFFSRAITINKRPFPITQLVVTEELEEKGYTPETIAQGITVDENALLREAMAPYTPRAYFSESFGYPLDKIVIVGGYGNIRKSGSSEIQHLGVDLDATVGTRAYAVNEGRAVFVRLLKNYGNTLIVDHGLGIYSLYVHLDSIAVKEGDTVSKGQIVAATGNTGYSIDPHLHFSIRVDGQSVDPLRFIKATNQ